MDDKWRTPILGNLHNQTFDIDQNSGPCMEFRGNRFERDIDQPKSQLWVQTSRHRTLINWGQSAIMWAISCKQYSLKLPLDFETTNKINKPQQSGLGPHLLKAFCRISAMVAIRNCSPCPWSSTPDSAVCASDTSWKTVTQSEEDTWSLAGRTNSAGNKKHNVLWVNATFPSRALRLMMSHETFLWDEKPKLVTCGIERRNRANILESNTTKELRTTTLQHWSP